VAGPQESSDDVSEETPAADSADKRAQVERLLTDILNLMEAPAALAFKDADDGSLAVAVRFAGEPPQGVVAGKRNYLVDSLQFLVNKCINRPNLPKRWVSLGVGDFPEPRAPKPPMSAPTAPATAAPVNGANHRPQQHEKREQPKQQQQARPPQPQRSSEPEEASLSPAEDAALTKLGKSLADRSNTLGRTYAVLSLSADDRARLLQAAKGSAGVTVRAEGEGIHRRLAFIPAKPVAMPKKSQMPDYPDDED
jgi:predicted RNA-binding protein Jag